MQVQKSSNHVAPLYVKCPPLAPLEEGGTTWDGRIQHLQQLLTNL
jgi:hypothetical protein